MKIAYVKAGAPPPGTIHTLADFLAWRAAEDARMLAELERQLAVYVDGRAAMLERDLAQAPQH